MAATPTATPTEEEFVLDLNKMKIADLKRELHLRGLKLTGNKQELMQRLQQYLEEHEGAEVEEEEEDARILNDDEEEGENKNEGDLPNGSIANTKGDAAVKEKPVPEVEDEDAAILNEDTDEVENKTIEQNGTAAVSTADDEKKVEVTESKTPVEENKSPEETPAMTDDEKKAARAEKFGLKTSDLSEADRKEVRAKKFGLKTKDLADDDRLSQRKKRFGNANGAVGANKLSKEGAEIDAEKLKKRTERFGAVVTDTSSKSKQKESLQKRKERFAAASVDPEVEAKKQKRAERFKNIEVSA